MEQKRGVFSIGDYVTYDSVQGRRASYKLIGVIIDFEPKFGIRSNQYHGVLVKILIDLDKICHVKHQRFFKRDLTKISKEEYETCCVLEDFS